jgi:hypothetical protein
LVWTNEDREILCHGIFNLAHYSRLQRVTSGVSSNCRGIRPPVHAKSAIGFVLPPC